MQKMAPLTGGREVRGVVVRPVLVVVGRGEDDARRARWAPEGCHSRPRFGCRAGTFSRSWRQIRSTRLSLTTQPASRSSALILR